MKGQKAKLAAFVARPAPREALPIEERLRRADAAMGEIAAEAPRTTVTETPVREDVEPPSVTAVVRQTPVHKTPVRRTPATETGVTRTPVDPWMWLNTPAVLNWALDEFLPTFDHNAQAVMLRLLRLTLGFRRRNRLVSIGTIAQKTKLTEATVTRVVRALREDRYVETQAVIDGRRRARRLEFILTDRALPPASLAERTGVIRTPVKGTRVTKTNMKNLLEEKNRKGAPVAVAPALGVFEIRKVATQIYEARHREPGFTAAELRATMRAELGGEGHDVAPEVLDEALRGML